MDDLHSELEAWAKSAYTRDLFCGATSLSETLRSASARIATLSAERDAERARVAKLECVIRHEIERSRRHLAASTISALNEKGPADE